MCGWLAEIFCQDISSDTTYVCDVHCCWFFLCAILIFVSAHLHRPVPRGSSVYLSVLSAFLALSGMQDFLLCFWNIIPIIVSLTPCIRGKTTAIVKRMHLAADHTAKKENESTYFCDTLAYTKTSFGAFGYIPRKKRTLCGQCERKTRETLDA